jgi:O-antigen ligase
MGQLGSNRKIIETGLPILLGLSLGVMTVFVRGLPAKWAGAFVFALMASVFVLLLGDIKKTVLIAFVVDMALGFDVALQNRGWHLSGPTGFLISLMTIALLVGYTTWFAGQSRPRIYWGKSMSVPLLVFMFLALVSVFQSVDVSFSMSSIFLMIQVFLMYFYIINHVRTWPDIQLVITVWAACLALEGTLMILQYFTGISLNLAGVTSQSLRDASASVNTVRVGGTLGGANGAAIWLTPSLAVALGAYLWYSAMRLPGRRLMLLAFLLGVGALVLTFSRSGWASFTLAMLVLGSLVLIRRGASRKRLMVVAVFGLVILAIFSSLLIRRFTEDDRGSAVSRKAHAEMAYDMIADQPVTGVGISNFDLRKFEYVPLELMGVHRKYVYVVHNHYLLVWAETGFLGLFVFIWVLLAAAGQCILWLNSRSGLALYLLSASLLAALAGYALHMRTDVFTTRMPVQLLWFMIALITTMNHLAAEPLSGDQGRISLGLSGDRIDANHLSKGQTDL